MSIHPHDILAWVGGNCLPKFGTLVRRTTPPSKRADGELVETFTRTDVAGTGWTVNGAGLLTRAGADIPRVRYYDLDADGVFETPTLLLEPAGTNLLTYSHQLDNAAWTKTACSINANANTAPDGTLTADQVIEDSSTGQHTVRQVVTATADATYTLSWYGKMGTRTVVQIVLAEDADVGNHASAYFDLSDGTVGTTSSGGTGTFVTAYIETLASNRYRMVVVGSVGNGATGIRCVARMADADNSNSYTGDGSSYIKLWGAMFEDSTSYASSYITTTTASVSRNADAFSIPFYPGPQTLSIYARGLQVQYTGAGLAGLYTIGEDATSPASGASIGGYVNADTTGGGAVRVWDGTTTLNVSQSLSGALNVGQQVETCATVPPTVGETVTFSMRADGGTTVTSTGAQTVAIDAYSQALLSVGRFSAIATAVQATAMQDVIVCRGTHTLDDFAALVA